MSARAHASAAVGLLGQTCCRQPRRGDRPSPAASTCASSAERERARARRGWGGAPLTGSLSDFANLHTRDHDALCARAFSARCPRHTSTDLHQVADTFRPATNLLPSLRPPRWPPPSSPHMTRAILLRSVNSNHSTDHLQAGHYAQATHPDYGQLWCFAAFPERGRHRKPHAPRMRGRLHPCLRALPPTPMTSTPARRSCTKIS